MVKLKSLRGSIGSYGRVAAGGIVEVDDGDAKKLLDTKRFVRASDADLKAAQAAQDNFLKVAVAGAASGFAPVAEGPRPIEDEFSAMEIDQQRKAIDDGFAALHAEHVRLEDRTADLLKRDEAVTARETAVADMEKHFAERGEANALEHARLDGEAKRLAALSEDLQKQRAEFDAAQKAAKEPKAQK